jgi:hypothetical protein
MSEWLPIKTAPRDGTQILICRKVSVGRPLIIVASFQIEYEDPEKDPSERMRFHQRTGFRNVRATHWMPLPDPPSEEEPIDGILG